MVANHVNNSILYWKWDNSTLDKQCIIDKVADLCNRTEMKYVSIGLHWIEKEFVDEELIEALKLCSKELHKRGRKIIIEVCPRKEGRAFFSEFPEDISYLTTATEILLDRDGKGTALVETTTPLHFWRTSDYKAKILGSFAILKTHDNKFEPKSKEFIKDGVTLQEHGDYSKINVNLGEKAANKHAVVFVGIPQSIPDLASEYLPELYLKMLNAIEDVDIDGVMSDEWGYDVIIGMEDNHENLLYNEPELYLEHVSYSKSFDKCYEELSGESLLHSLLYFYYEDNSNRGKSIKAVNDYHKTFRYIMRKNDEDMYNLAKEKLGDDIFYGAHPTWWGHNYLQNFEGFKNGLYWWEAKRDIAQTDEIVIMPIRTSLAHKWGSPYWYNMWYSMGTRDIKTYYKESWNNLRFGGRTHYLSYECPNESVVLELKGEGLLESIEEMDQLIRMVDTYQSASPDCRVLLLFGMENSLNWFYNDNPTPPWHPRHKILSSVLECADKIFDEYLCDLVPTSEIVNDSLKVKNGKAYYGTQEYDAVILLGPNSMETDVFTFLSQLDSSRLMVAGEFNEYYDGLPISKEDSAILKKGVYESNILCPDKIISILKKWGIPQNRFTNGCVLQDGSIIFTSEGEKASHNTLNIDVTYNDTHINFDGEDFLFLHNTDEGIKAIYPKGCLNIDL